MTTTHPPGAGHTAGTVPITWTNPRLHSVQDVSGFRLPYSLASRYEVVSMLPKQGGEAVLLTVRPLGSQGPIHVLKLYARELGLRTDVLELVRNAGVDHVVRLLDFGTEHGVGYELLEYVPAGDLDDHVRRHGLLDEHSARAAVAEIARAIECIHGLTAVELAHGDLKPTNILVRTLDPLDLVLADFGMATLEHDTRSPVLGTPRWSDPRAHTGYIQPEGDWWSLGAIAYWLRTGQPLMAHLETDAAAIDYLRENNADLTALPVGDSLDWQRLCRGLLVRDESQRWGAEEVRQWLDGGSPEVGSQWDEPELMVAPEPTHPITFGGRHYVELAEFALALAEDWDGSRTLVEHRVDDLAEVLAEHARQTKDLDLARDVSTILEAGEPVDLRLSRLIRRLAPQAPPVFQRWSLETDSLAGLADRAAANPDAPEAGAISALHDAGILSVWDYPELGGGVELDRRWHSSVQRWSDVVTAHLGPDAEPLSRRARAVILQALLRPGEAQRLTKRARTAASRRARRVDWYDRLCGEIGRDPAVDYAVIALAPTAEGQAEAADAAAREERQRQAFERWEATLTRVPRTRRILGWCLIIQAGLVALWAALRVLAPRSQLGLTPEQGLSLWTELPDRVANWVTWWTDPLVVLPLFGVSALLYWRARAGGPGGRVARHPLERRAGQAAIALTCLLVPPLIPVGLFGWWRGLQLYAPGPIRRRDALRTISMGSGLAATAVLIGLVVGVWPPAASLALTAEYQQWAVADDILTAVAGPMTAVGHLAGGIAPTGAALAVTVVVCLSGPLLIGLAARAYAVDALAVRRGMAALVLAGIVALATLPLAYLPLAWGGWAAAAAALWVGWVVLRGRR